MFKKFSRSIRRRIGNQARGKRFAASPVWLALKSYENRPAKNDLEEFFDRNTDGPGIWKWRHYFDIYDRHFSKFRGAAPTVLEIGVFSGGSLAMWKDYFGPGAKIVGVDIEPDCKRYESTDVRIFIGDQADRDFWQGLRREVPKVDIVIDDGGHLPEQQMVSMEEMLPHLAPGGVYLCEDIHSERSSFASMVHGLADTLNNNRNQTAGTDPERRTVVPSTPFQSRVRGIHLYPFVAVIETNELPRTELVSTKHGTKWEPFLS
jgi:SAM-dependent methyltransferase